MYSTSFQGSTMLTRPEVLQCFFFILEPSVFIPKGGGILEPSNLRVWNLHLDLGDTPPST